MSVHDDAADVLHDVQDTVKAMFADEWVAGGILHDMVARFDPSLTHGYSVVARGWRSLLQTATAKNNADNSAFWVALYEQYQRVCAYVPDCDGSVDAFVSLLQAGEDNSNWADGDDDRIAAMCLGGSGAATDSDDAAPSADTETVSADKDGDVDDDDVVEDVTDDTDTVTDDTDVITDDTDTATDEDVGVEGDAADAPDAADEAADNEDASPAQPAPAQPQPAQQPTKRTRRKRTKTKAASPKRKTRKASDKPMSTRTADDGATITPVDVDFRVREDLSLIHI